MIWNMYNGPILLGLFLALLECASRFYFHVFYPTTIFLLSTLFAVLSHGFSKMLRSFRFSKDDWIVIPSILAWCLC